MMTHHFWIKFAVVDNVYILFFIIIWKQIITIPKGMNDKYTWILWEALQKVQKVVHK